MAHPGREALGELGRQCQALNGPSVQGSPSGQKEGTISRPLPAGRASGLWRSCSHICGSAGSRPGPLKEGGDLGWAQDPVLRVVGPRRQGQQERPEELGRGPGLGGADVLPTGRQQPFISCQCPRPKLRGTGRCAGTGSRVSGSTLQPSLPPSPPPRRRPRPALCPGRSVLGRPRSRRRLTKLPLCPAASAGPADVSLCDQPGRAEHGRRRPLAAGGGGANPGAPPSRGQPFREPAPTRSGRGCPREKVQAPRWHSGPAPQASPALPSAIPFPSNARALPTASWSLPSSESMICSPPGPACGNHHMVIWPPVTTPQVWRRPSGAGTFLNMS